MKEQLMNLLLIAGLNIPVYLELYKHALKQKPLWLKTVAAALYWLLALLTQTIPAFIGILYLFIVYYKKEEINEVLRSTDVWNIRLRDAVKTVLLTLGMRILLVPISYGFTLLLIHFFRLELVPQDIVVTYSHASLLLRLLLGLDIALIAPVVEEFVFRHFLYDKIFFPRMPRFVAALFSAGLFTILHFNVAGVPTFLGLGLLCTFLYEKKGYWAAVTAHSTSNIITLLLI
jgi:membrane protease YdiL (CAAX protease family)